VLRSLIALILGLAGALGLLAVATLITQIIRCSAEMTQTETALFGILQFVFSIAFGWILSRASYKKEFEENQRQFAIAAYRRIREIEHTVSRLLSRIKSRRSGSSPEVCQELDVLQEVTTSILTTSRSSISDWADIIGDEITTVEELEKLRRERSSYIEDTDLMALTPLSKISPDIAAVKGRLDAWEEKMEELLERLPASLQVIERHEKPEALSLTMAIMAASDELRDHKCLVLPAVWEPDAGFDRDVRDVDPGAIYTIMRGGPVGSRENPIVVKDNNGKSIGIITNKYMLSDYDTFATAIFEALRTTAVKVNIELIEHQDQESKRVHFRVRTASHTLDDSENQKEVSWKVGSDQAKLLIINI